MLNTTKRVLALMLALVLVLSLAACSKPTGEGSSVEYVIEEEVIYENQGGTTSGDGQGNNNNQTNANTPGSNTNTPGNTPSGGTGDYVVNKVTQAELDKLRGTTVKFASTIDPKDDGTQYVVDQFEKEYGIKVEIVKCTLPGYIQEMQGKIANDDAPDVGRSNGDFPACVAYFDSLDKAKLDYTDPIWNQNTFKLTTFNGSPYMCDTYGCYWTELDICIYNKRLLKDAGVPTPKELAAQGKWTWDNFMMLAEKCTDKMGAPAGAIFTNELALHMAGGNVFKIENEKIVSGIDANTVNVVKKFAEAWKKNILNGNSTRGIVDGTTAIGTGHAWSLRKDGDIKNAPAADIEFWFLPSYTEGAPVPATGIFRGFGIMRKAKNPVAGGIFLREYLDVNNYKTDTAFINDDAKNFFFELTTKDYADNYNPYLTYNYLNEDIAGVAYTADIYAVMKMDPSAVDAKMASVKAAVEKGADNLNKHINKYIYSN